MFTKREALKNILKETIIKVLNEELGVSDDVLKTTKEVINLIKKGNYDFQVRLTELIITVIVTFVEGIYSSKGMYDSRNNTLFITIRKTNNKINYNEVESVVQHELHHAFQEHMVNGRENEYYALYKKATDYLLHNPPSGNIEYILAQIIYMCAKIELDANLNSSYPLLKNELINGKDIRKPQRLENLYQNIEKAKNILIQNINVPYTVECAKKYGKTPKWFVSLTDTALRNLKKKNLKIVNKVNMDYNKEKTNKSDKQ